MRGLFDPIVEIFIKYGADKVDSQYYLFYKNIFT